MLLPFLYVMLVEYFLNFSQSCSLSISYNCTTADKREGSFMFSDCLCMLIILDKSSLFLEQEGYSKR